MSDDEKKRALAAEHNQYGTFQGVGSYPPPPSPPPPPPPEHPPPAMGFPHPVPPPGSSEPSAPPQYYAQGYQAVPGYPVAEGRPVRERRLPCCGLGCGWCLFIIGFFLAAIPWYVGLLVFLCTRNRMDHREKPGYIACTIAAVLATIAAIIGGSSSA